MDNLIFSINVVAPLFILLMLGYLVKKTGIISQTFIFEANKFAFKILIPVLLFQKIRIAFTGEFANFNLMIVTIIISSIILILLLIIIPVFIKTRGRQGAMIQGIYRSNYVIFGIPMAVTMYGVDAAHSIAVLMGVVIPFYNITAVILLTFFNDNQKKIKALDIVKDVFKNPFIIGCIAGGLFGFFEIHIPHIVDLPLSDIAKTATPFALFFAGADFKFRKINNNILPVLFASFSRLIIVPVIAICIFIWLGFRNLELCVLLCIFASPTSVSSFVMAKNMGADGELANQIVVVTTVSSSITIFLLIFALRSLGYLG